MRLTSGSPAPVFRVTDVFGTSRALSDYRGKRLLISFFRYSQCAICNLRVHHMIELYQEFRSRGLEMLAVFESPRDNVVSNVNKQNVPFALVADPEARLYELFGVENSQEKVTAPPPDPERLQAQIAEANALGYPLQREEGGNFFRMPADFVIGPTGLLEAAFYSEAIGAHLPWDQVEGLLAVVQ